VVNPRTSWGKIRQRPAYINEYRTCSVHSSHVLPLHWNKPSFFTLVTPRSWRPCSLYGAPLRQFLYGAPLRQFLYGAPLLSFTTYFYKRLTTRLSSKNKANKHHPVEDDPSLTPAEKRYDRSSSTELLYGSSSTELLYGSSSTAVPLRQFLFGSSSTAAPLRQLLYGSSSTTAPLRQLLYDSSSTTAPLRQLSTAASLQQPLASDLPPSWSFCDVKPLQPRQLACASAGVQLLSAAPAALVRHLPPSCGTCHPRN
jgi:hypothetical protein